MNGLVAILFVGPRRGRFDGSRPDSDFEESSPTSMLFGLFMLWWGWIGFNCGSTFGITDDKWLVAARAGVNTINASAGGGIASMFFSKYHTKGRYFRPPDIVNGILGALVASSPTCACVHTYDSLFIGAIGALIACWSNEIAVKKWWKLDDPVGALGVHAAGGFWGTFAVALFADASLPGIAGTVENGLFRGGGFELMGIQLMGLAAIAAWSIVTMTPFFYQVGVFNSRNWSNPRKGLRYDFDHMDQVLHGCTEDPTDKITEQIHKELEQARRDMLLASRDNPHFSGARLAIMTETPRTRNMNNHQRRYQQHQEHQHQHQQHDEDDTPATTDNETVSTPQEEYCNGGHSSSGSHQMYTESSDDSSMEDTSITSC